MLDKKDVERGREKKDKPRTLKDDCQTFDNGDRVSWDAGDGWVLDHAVEGGLMNASSVAYAEDTRNEVAGPPGVRMDD
jgi:hypothetical protein